MAAWRVMGTKMAVPFHTCKRWLLAGMLFGASAHAEPLSETFMYSGDVESALKAAGSEARLAPSDMAAQERWIDLQLTLGLTARAVAAARERVAQQPQSADAHYLLGRAVPTADQARQAYERALRIDPMHARSHMGMGAVYTAEVRIEDAIAAYGRATTMDPSLAEAWLGLSRAHLVREDLPSALSVTRAAMKAVPGSPDAYLTAAVLDPGTARTTLETAARLAGKDARVHASLGELQLGAGEIEAALESARRALAIDPTDPSALRVRLFATAIQRKTLDVPGWRALLEAQGADDPTRFDGLVAKYPKAALVWAGRSQARLARKDTAGALSDLTRASELDPDEPEIQGAFGLLLLQQGRPADAASWLARAHAARPWDASLGIAYGQALGRSGKAEQAVEVLSRLSERRRFDSEVAIAHADALLLARRPDVAYQVILQAAERRMDQRIMIALMAVATQVGRFDEAAGILEEIGRTTGDAAALELAARLRAKAP